MTHKLGNFHRPLEIPSVVESKRDIFVFKEKEALTIVRHGGGLPRQAKQVQYQTNFGSAQNTQIKNHAQPLWT